MTGCGPAANNDRPGARTETLDFGRTQSGLLDIIFLVLTHGGACRSPLASLFLLAPLDVEPARDRARKPATRQQLPAANSRPPRKDQAPQVQQERFRHSNVSLLCSAAAVMMPCAPPCCRASRRPMRRAGEPHASELVALTLLALVLSPSAGQARWVRAPLRVVPPHSDHAAPPWHVRTAPGTAAAPTAAAAVEPWTPADGGLQAAAAADLPGDVHAAPRWQPRPSHSAQWQHSGEAWSSERDVASQLWLRESLQEGMRRNARGRRSRALQQANPPPGNSTCQDFLNDVLSQVRGRRRRRWHGCGAGA